MTVRELLDEIAGAAHNASDKGRTFERLMASYFRTDPLYKERFKNVWLWNDWVHHIGNKGQDIGIDIVAEEADGSGYCAVQCKFYTYDHTLQKSDIDSFFTASGKSPFTSRIIVSTCDKWSKNAEEALDGQDIKVSRIDVKSLGESPIDWIKYSLKNPERMQLKPQKSLRPHQERALAEVIAGFRNSAKGKLIMACGTGKTFTSLKIMEKITNGTGTVVFLAPSISLISQTLREWTAEISPDIEYRAFVVCSDSTTGRKNDSEDIYPCDLAYPPTTDAKILVNAVKKRANSHSKDGDYLTIIFSTYQSIEVLSEAQKLGLVEFDLVICDEAHRTTGVTLSDREESAFVRVHNQDFIRAKKRLYMTATPRVYAESSKIQAKDNDALLCSMDDEAIYGPEFHRLGFGEAVEKDLLSDYKVIILGVEESYVSSAFQHQIADSDGAMKLDDVVKIIGCWNGLTKRKIRNFGDDLTPMRRAVAFSRSIKDSELIVKEFPEITEKCRKDCGDENLPRCEADHVDGKMNVMTRSSKLDWLKEDFPSSEEGGALPPCRILSNARCLSEGVDVPALDAVLFLNPRDSVVDVVQSVGRVMRKAPGKRFGYIILPIGIPSDIEPEKALSNNKKYEVVWKVLQALRSHDDRFNATINKIELNKKAPEVVGFDIIGAGDFSSDDKRHDENGNKENEGARASLSLPYHEWSDALYAKIVLKCGERKYWEQWAQDIAEIAQRHIERIRTVVDENDEARECFGAFIADLRQDINPNVSADEAIEMLAQHGITRPVFDALFDNYSFAANNPVSVSMQKVLDLLEEKISYNELEKLEEFYNKIRAKASDIDNSESKQTLVVKLYDNFFRAAFPKMAERLGIVYTPVEVVDFIIKSADAALRMEFGGDKSLASENVHIIDPFTGTGTFIVRLIQSGLIPADELQRKYDAELHANEIVLLAYYIAAINIEEAYHGVMGEYRPFGGIVLTDTFQLYEDKLNNAQQVHKSFLAENGKRASKQKETPIKVIIGNPPYSVGQGNQNDDNQNLKYKNLDNRIRKTYAEHSTGTNKNSLYDSYIRAIRWASERIEDKGIVCFVSNGSFIDGNVHDGLRKCLAEEFSKIYCFNLRGNARTSGEIRRKERDNVFGMGTRTNVAITLLIKNPEKRGLPCEIFYHDIGDSLSRAKKLKIIKEANGISGIEWQKITPNTSHDWINHRDEEFSSFLPIGSKDDELKDKTIFDVYSPGVQTNRDAWVYNFSEEKLRFNMSRMIEKYDNEVVALMNNPNHEICYDSTQIKWSSSLLSELHRKNRHGFNSKKIVEAMYRPFCKSNLYFDGIFNHRTYQMPKIFPHASAENLVICVTGTGASKEFSVYIANAVPDVQLMANGQCFPLYTYQKSESRKQSSLFDTTEQSAQQKITYTRHENINDTVLEAFRSHYDDAKITKEDIFYYVYGLLHSPEYREKYASDLKKMLPHIPFAEDFRTFSVAGCELAKWHLDYENVDPYPVTVSDYPEPNFDDEKLFGFYHVQKMRFPPKKDDGSHKSTILYNKYIKIENIPIEAYNYVVNGRSAIEWVMERYQVTVDKDSKILNDPNLWSREHRNPRYIFDLLLKVIRVSLESVKIIERME